jgi:hypothetical protein
MEAKINKWTNEQVLEWVNGIKNEIRKNPQCSKATEEELNEMVLDGMFEGFQKGELSRKNLARIAKLLGYELSEEFMNDPHPDPIDMKKQ